MRERLPIPYRRIALALAAVNNCKLNERHEIEHLFRKLCQQPKVRFPEQRGHLDAPVTQGVYVIRDSQRRVVHVGRTYRGSKGLNQRLRNHLQAASSFTIKHLNGQGSKLRDGYTFAFLEVPDPRKRALLEAYATGSLCPTHLGVGDPKKSGVADEMG